MNSPRANRMMKTSPGSALRCGMGSFTATLRLAAPCAAFCRDAWLRYGSFWAKRQRFLTPAPASGIGKRAMRAIDRPRVPRLTIAVAPKGSFVRVRARMGGRKRKGAGMRLGRIGFVWIAFVAASTQASADDLSATQPKPARSHAAKTKIVGPAAPKGDGLSGIPFSDPYAPPVGAGKATGGGFPAAAKAAPKDPQGDLSFTYK